MQCVGIRSKREKRAKWYVGRTAVKKLNSIDWSTTGLLCHNTAFDGLILSHHYGIVPAFYYDTLSMARAMLSNTIGNSLDEVGEHLNKGRKVQDVLDKTKGILDIPRPLMLELGRYCAQDVDLMWEIFLEWIDTYPEDELQLIHHTIGAFANPVLMVDIPRAEKDLKRTLRKTAKIFMECAHLLNLDHLRGKVRTEAVSKVLGSDNQLAEAFKEIGFEPPMKTTAKGTYKPAFAQSDLPFKEMLVSPNHDVKLLANARVIAKSNIAETRAKKLILHALPALPIMLNYCRAHTMRWSGGDDMNPQNFPARSKG